MKKALLSTLIGLSLIALCFLTLKSCIIQNPSPEDCVVVEVKITKITEGGVKDIVFHDDSTDFYYINRSLERALNLVSLKTKFLNNRLKYKYAHHANLIKFLLESSIVIMNIFIAALLRLSY